MSNTSAVAVRFWAAMTSRYGRRWPEQFGEEPPSSWVKMLDAYPPDTIMAAMSELGEVSADHPPTMPLFESLLRRVARKVTEEASQDWLRGYWRSVIVANLSAGLRLSSAELKLRLSRDDELRLSALDLLDRLCELERRTGQRTEGMETTCVRECYRMTAGRGIGAEPVPL